MNTRQLLSVGIDIGTTTTQVIFSHLELVNRAAVSQVPRYEFIKREISWQSPVFFTPVDKQGGLKEAELKTLILEQYQAAGIAPESVDSGAIIITGESAKTRNARPAVMVLSQSLVDFVARFPNPHPLLVVAGQDFGKALGMLLRPQLQQLPLAVIDEVIVRAGDYIDIGTPLFGGSVVPVTVKSLAFPS